MGASSASGRRDEVEAAWRSRRRRATGAPPLPAAGLRDRPPTRSSRSVATCWWTAGGSSAASTGACAAARAGRFAGPTGPESRPSSGSSSARSTSHPAAAIRRLDLGPSADVRDVRARVGLVAPDLQARHRGDATGLEVALSGFGGSIGLGEDPTPSQRESAQAWLDALGAAHLADRSIQAMSYGELRRLLFARALVTDPDVLLLDEPFSGLEPRARAEAMDLVDRLCRAGRSAVLVTHHDDEVLPSIAFELRLRDGRVERAGSLR